MALHPGDNQPRATPEHTCLRWRCGSGTMKPPPKRRGEDSCHAETRGTCTSAHGDSTSPRRPPSLHRRHLRPRGGLLVARLPGELSPPFSLARGTTRSPSHALRACVHVAGQDRALNSVEGEVLGPVGSESCMLALNSLGGLICWFMQRGDWFGGGQCAFGNSTIALLLRLCSSGFEPSSSPAYA
jgi:hypothetical protein